MSTLTPDHTIPTPGDHLRHAERIALLERVWANGRGLVGQLTAVNHTTIALRFIVTGLVFLLIGGMLSMFIRLQLSWPGLNVLDPERYAQFVTMHGTTMMFLFAVPIMEGFAMYLIPKMLGTRDLPFPRLSAFGWWCYLFGGIFLYSSFIFGSVPDGGWFMYTPLTDSTYSPGKGADFWLIGVTFAEIAAVTAAVELIVAILVTRAPGMDLTRMPLFAWAVLVTAFMIAFGFPPLILASLLLEIQRAFDFAFFEVARGGDPLLWQHLFWLFGHPEVYIIFLPAAGVVSTIVPTFARRPIVGYTWVVLALVATGFLSFGLWVHHMFAVGIPLLALAFFSAASMAVAIPTGIQIFAWIATLWAGKPWLRVPMLYIIGFFITFVCGGLTGVMLAFVPFDWQAHDTHFVVAHLHYVLIGGMMFPMFAGLYYWLPLASGRMPSESLSRSGFWLVFIGFHLAFLPMHITGLVGMPRRVDSYAMELGVQWLNLLSTAAGFVLAVGIVAILIDVALCFRLGRRGTENPWQAGTLEWALPHPAPKYNFASIPVVDDRNPLWHDPGVVEATRRTDGLLGEAVDGRRWIIGTGIQSAQPEQAIRLSNSTWLPLFAALTIAVLLGGFITSQYWLSILMLLPLIGLFLRWLWTVNGRETPLEIEVAPGLRLPTQALARNAPGWWALVGTLMIVGSLFASLVFAYFYLWLNAPAWPGGGATLTASTPMLAALGALLAAGVGAWRMPIALRAGHTRAAVIWSAFAILSAIACLALQLPAIADAVGAPQRHAYGSVVWTLAGFQALHIAVAVLIAGFVALRIHHGHVDAVRSLEARIATGFWRYVVAQGLIVWALLHLFPRFA
ncbi:cytochrome c oxidase subunit I [Luteimonas fraxinea]|uniref:cytochrome-c oxidase n=1 Tax=Luteimonas fraxinea TaxID=2901869 RepID=A0ABS8UGE5_9GAMM|nr:cytochrome c oxidase subunit I [Luteimonas fraxinea]MCD9098334.1 cytochrome c oxidase subunit I [Luteimonas fraxinea]MCD9127066.1 cytochrome c oxidase subunit I [Luteimonas fraxinea]UHH08732.1 cytochrome c oxidase subunit I [Luteimonas fraxinea]